MNIEFHFYMTNILAKRAGFSENDSYIIAYSSQYTDDNCIIYKINKGKEDEYSNYISQTMNILKPKRKLMRIYPCFHFVPGLYDSDLAKRKDGNMHMLNTTQNNKNSNILMDKALSTGDLYSIGIATHTYADTWAHQNFVGYYDYFNGMGGLLEKIMPNIGHADVQNDPDIPGLVWEDERLLTGNRQINNKERFINAAENIFKKYRLHLNNTLSDEKITEEWQSLKKDLEYAIGREFRGKKDKEYKNRTNRYKEIIGSPPDYDEDDWFNEAVETDVVGLPDNQSIDLLAALKMFPDKYYKKPGFENSHWFKFQEAVKSQQDLAEDLYEKLFKQMEVKDVEEY